MSTTQASYRIGSHQKTEFELYTRAPEMDTHGVLRVGYICNTGTSQD
jgi:hypothetical protein